MRPLYSVLVLLAYLPLSTPQQCLLASGAPCPQCSTACAECQAGTYGDGIATACQGCPAGTFSNTNRTTSSTACGPCTLGYTTLPTDSGLTACTTCADAGRGFPNNAEPDVNARMFFCLWNCKTAYIRWAVADQNPTVLKDIYAQHGYTDLDDASAQLLYHRDADFCCSGALTDKGERLVRCSRSYDGDRTACPVRSNAHYIKDGTTPQLSLDRCNDWACNAGYYKTTYCQSQPACPALQTYNRSASGDYLTLPTGSFGCTPCSQCLAGSEAVTACNRTHDTACRMCNATSYSLAGGRCGAVPLGYRAVKIHYAAMPAFQGRPGWQSDGTTPILANDWQYGMYFRTYTACAPSPWGTQYVAQSNSDACSLEAGATGCVNPTCSYQCKPWNGTAGYYASDGKCVECRFDPTQCTDTQYLNMAACGPDINAQCASCPDQPVTNGLRWSKPATYIASRPYPCDVVCKDGFTRSGYTCTNCPAPPANAYISSGCNWTCMLDFVPVPGGCASCPALQPCGVGTYPGYAKPTDQCRSCAPCETLTTHVTFTTAGANGPNTCSYVCAPGYFYTTVDAYGNPWECIPCAQRVCDSGNAYLTPCTATADADCAPCDSCAPGFDVARPCTPTNNTVCAACAQQPPSNADWTTGCAWACADGYTLNGTTECSACKRLCAPSERLVTTNGCGACVACDPLAPGRAYLGDGQCGTYALTCLARAYPRNGKATASTDVVLCPWACNAGYTLVSATGSNATLFHRDNDACCDSRLVGAGQQLVNCTFSAPGVVQACAAKPNAHWVLLAGERLSRCADFECNAGYYYSSPTCVQQTTTTQRPTTTTPQPTTTPPPTTTPVLVTTYASLVALSLPKTLTSLTSSVLTQLTADVNTQTGCAALPTCRTLVLAITNATGATVYCVNGTCPGAASRRLLLAAYTPIGITFGVLSADPLPKDTAIAPTLGGIALEHNESLNAPVTQFDLSNLLLSIDALIAYVQTHAPPPNAVADTTPAAFPVAIVAAVAGLAGVAGVGIVALMRLRKKRALQAQMPPAQGLRGVRITLKMVNKSV